MDEEVIEYYGHEFIKHAVLDPQYEGYFRWKCSRCNHEMIFLVRIKSSNGKILTCDERIIKNIIE